MRFNIANLAGDGVGPEVLNEGVKVLRAAQKAVGGFELEFQDYAVGANCYLKTGSALSEAVFQECKKADAIFMGAIGIPGVVDAHGTEVTGHVMFKIRFDLELFAGVRPIKLYPGVRSGLTDKSAIDFVVLRENCEGLFASYGGGTYTYDEVATDTMVITRKGSERLFDYAFELAKKRNGRVLDGKKMVTCSAKWNVFRSFAFFKKIFDEIAEKYEGQVQRDYAIIDALTLWMVQQPENFDVIVTENMFGDIISDLAAGFIGGMGMAPSGDIGVKHAMFQPSHGTAPTIAGKGVANPSAAILSGKMMLDWLGEKRQNEAAKKAAALIEEAVAATILQGIKTRDIGGSSSTQAFGDAVVVSLEKLTQ